MPRDRDDVEIQPLLDDLRRRREASIGTANPIHQAKIAREMNYASGTVSRYESGERDIRALPGEKVAILLRGYGYDTLDIKAAVEKYRLNPPPNLVSPNEPPGMVRVMHEGTVTTPTEPQWVTAVDATRGRFKPSDLRQRTVGSGDLVTGRARDRFPIGATLWLHVNRQPERDDFVIVEQDGREAICKWPLEEPVFTLPLDLNVDQEPLRLLPGEAKPRRVVVTYSVDLIL